MTRYFKSRFQTFIRRYRTSSRKYTWLENTVPSKLKKRNIPPPIKRLIEGLRRKYPPPIPQLASSISVPNDCCAWGLLTISPYMQSTEDLIMIDFNYLLRCGK